MTPWSAARWATTRGALARSSSAASGFFFCGMIEEPDAHASATSQKPNSSLDHSTISAPSRDRCVAQVAAARQEVEHEVAVGDRVDRVRRRPTRSRARAPAARGRWRSSRRRARPRRAAARSVEPSTNSNRARVAPEHPEVRQQVVREVDGLRALQVRVAGHRPVQVRVGELDQHALERAAGARALRSACARVNIAMSVATWSLRERAVCSLPPTGPTISVRRRSIAMWMSSSSGSKGNSPSSSSALDPLEPARAARRGRPRR